MALAVVNLFEIGIVRSILDALLRGHDLIIAAHNCHSPKFQSLREMHGPDRNLPQRNLDLIAQFDSR
jgi:hypothetical protein